MHFEDLYKILDSHILGHIALNDYFYIHEKDWVMSYDKLVITYGWFPLAGVIKGSRHKSKSRQVLQYSQIT